MGVSLLPIVEHLHDLRPFGQDAAVTADAPFDRGDPGHRPAPRVGMTELAVDARLLDVPGVAEGDRLLVPVARCRAGRLPLCAAGPSGS